jgi:hypothetical protein
MATKKTASKSSKGGHMMSSKQMGSKMMGSKKGKC